MCRWVLYKLPLLKAATDVRARRGSATLYITSAAQSGWRESPSAVSDQNNLFTRTLSPLYSTGDSVRPASTSSAPLTALGTTHLLCGLVVHDSCSVVILCILSLLLGGLQVFGWVQGS